MSYARDAGPEGMDACGWELHVGERGGGAGRAGGLGRGTTSRAPPHRHAKPTPRSHSRRALPRAAAAQAAHPRRARPSLPHARWGRPVYGPVHGVGGGARAQEVVVADAAVKLERVAELRGGGGAGRRAAVRAPRWGAAREGGAKPLLRSLHRVPHAPPSQRSWVAAHRNASWHPPQGGAPRGALCGALRSPHTTGGRAATAPAPPARRRARRPPTPRRACR